MEQDGTTVSSPKTISVQLKICGEDLEVLREFSECLTIKLSSENAQQRCTVQFLDGELMAEIVLVFLRACIRSCPLQYNH